MTLGTRQQHNRENLPPASTNALLSPGEMCPALGGSGVDALPRKEGRVEMFQALPGGNGRRKVKVPVVLKVYGTAYGRYAVVGQDRKGGKDCGFINLRHCTVLPLATSPRPNTRGPAVPSPSQSQCTGFQIIPRHCEGEPLQFSVADSAALREWLSVLDPESDSASPKSSSPVQIPSPRRAGEEEGSLSPRRPLGWLQTGSSPKLQPAMPCLSEGDEEEEEDEES